MSALPPSFVNIPKGQQIHLTGTDELGDSIDVIGAVAEDFSFSINTSWQPVISGAFGYLSFIRHPFVSTIQGLDSSALNLTGWSGLNPALTQKIWRSSSYIELNVPLMLNAISDVQADILTPISVLNKLQLPSVSNGIMKAPGPTFLDTNSKYDISLFVGNYLFDQVVVESVSTVSQNLVDRDTQYFNNAVINLSISTSTIMTKDVIDDILSGNNNPNAISNATKALKQQYHSVLNSIKGVL